MQRHQKLEGMQTQKNKLKAVSTCSCCTKCTQNLPQINIFLAFLFISKSYEPSHSLGKTNIFPLNTLKNIFKGLVESGSLVKVNLTSELFQGQYQMLLKGLFGDRSVKRPLLLWRWCLKPRRLSESYEVKRGNDGQCHISI